MMALRRISFNLHFHLPFPPSLSRFRLLYDPMERSLLGKCLHLPFAFGKNKMLSSIQADYHGHQTFSTYGYATGAVCVILIDLICTPQKRIETTICRSTLSETRVPRATGRPAIYLHFKALIK